MSMTIVERIREAESQCSVLAALLARAKAHYVVGENAEHDTAAVVGQAKTILENCEKIKTEYRLELYREQQRSRIAFEFRDRFPLLISLDETDEYILVRAPSDLPHQPFQVKQAGLKIL